MDSTPLAQASLYGTDPADQDRLACFKHLTEHLLPTRACEQHWPIRRDHCFKRICLDHAFEDVWYNHLPRPAERNLTGNLLTRAVLCAEELATGDLALLRTRNTASLRYRGKSQPFCQSFPKGICVCSCLACLSWP